MRGALLLQAQPWEMPKQWLCFYSVSGALRLGREQSGRSFRCWWNACRGILHAQLPSCAICFLLQCRWTSHHADMDHTDSQGARLASVDGETFGLRDVLTKNNNKSPTWFKKKRRRKRRRPFWGWFSTIVPGSEFRTTGVPSAQVTTWYLPKRISPSLLFCGVQNENSVFPHKSKVLVSRCIPDVVYVCKGYIYTHSKKRK